MNNPYPNTPNSNSISASSSSSSSSETNPSKMADNQKPQQHKKQVRRRLHTTRPYQERLMNMAEARREIVTALKHHRASMRNAAGDGATGCVQTPPDPPPRSQERRIRPRKLPKSSINSNSDVNLNLNLNSNLNMNLCYPWMMMEEGNSNNLEIELPEQTLGLNLNLKDLDASLFSNGGVASGVKSDGGEVRHVAVGEEEMEEIRSIGEKHSVEWSDKMSMVKSAWWLKFMKMDGDGDGEGEFEFELKDPFDQILDFPDWINNGNQMCFDQQLFSDYHPSSALPCMDIGEFEGMDGEWLA